MNFKNLCVLLQILICFCGMLSVLSLEVRKSLWTRTANDREKTISSALSSFPAASAHACAVSCVISVAVCTKFSFDYDNNECYLEPTLENNVSHGQNSVVHFSNEQAVSSETPCSGYEGYHRVPEGSTCIRVYSSSKDYQGWQTAQDRCREQSPHSDLVRIEDEAKRDQLGDLITALGEHHQQYWVGATDAKEEGRFVWGDGGVLTDTSLFQTGQPDNGEDDTNEEEDCLFLMSGSRKLGDAPCHYSYAYICEMQVYV